MTTEQIYCVVAALTILLNVLFVIVAIRRSNERDAEKRKYDELRRDKGKIF